MTDVIDFLQVAIKIIDKTQLNPGSLQKVIRKPGRERERERERENDIECCVHNM